MDRLKEEKITMSNPSKKSVSYQVITDAIIAQLEKGTVPWRKPWTSESPANLISKKSYRGINVFMLSIQPYACPYWVTYKQAKSLGGHVRKGEKSTPVVFWKWFDNISEDENGEEVNKRRPMLRYYRVFNAEQCEGIPADKIPAWGQDATRQFNPIEEADKIVNAMPQKPIIKHEGQAACYNVLSDVVTMPPKELFHSEPEYYGTLFHELGHATGAEARLHRFNSSDPVNFGNADYSKEELIAEMSSAFLCGASQLELTLDNSAAYIQGWLKKLKEDHRLVVLADRKSVV